MEKNVTLTIPLLIQDCPNCTDRLKEALLQEKGILAIPNLEETGITITYDPDLIAPARVVEKLHESGVEALKRYDHQTITLTDLDCPDCAVKVEKAVNRIPQVLYASVNFATSKMRIEYETDVLSPQKTQEDLVQRIIRVVNEAGYGAFQEQDRPQRERAPFWKTNKRALFTIISGFFLLMALGSNFLASPLPLTRAFFTLSLVAAIGHPIRGAILSLKTFTLDMNMLMTVAVAGALVIGQWEEATVVAFLFSLGNTLESLTMNRTREAIKALMSLVPQEALVKRGEQAISLPLSEVIVGDRILVRPGEKIPLDGTVMGGDSTVNQAPLTGESLPVDKTMGDEVYAGTINGQGTLEIKVTRLSTDSTLTKIIHLVEEAQAQRAPSQQFVDRFARYYTPAVIGLAAALAIFPPILGNAPFEPWIYRALALLIIACPCALVISTPVSIVSAIGHAAREGILIKGGAYLEKMGEIKVIAFDKTGTLTQGKPAVTEVLSLNTMSAEKILTLAASLEATSEHPLGLAIVRHARHEGLRFLEIKGFHALVGRGARAELDGQTYYIGNQSLFQELGLPLASLEQRLKHIREEGKTYVLLGTESQLLGVIVIGDEPRPTIKETFAHLRRRGINRLVMLTGDNQGTAEFIAAKLGVDEVHAQLLPRDKAAAIKGILARWGKVAMVGDGVNDAPALASSTVGIAMGTTGTDAALETADIVLMSDDLSKIPHLVELSRRTRRVVRQNVIFSLAVKATIIALAFPGWLTLWLAVAGDMGSSLLVTLNGLSLLTDGLTKSRKNYTR